MLIFVEFKFKNLRFRIYKDMQIKILKEQWYRINSEKTDYELAAKFNSDNILRNNPNINLFDGEWIKFKVNNYTTHIVRPAQTLAEIASQHSKTVEEIMKTNNLQSNKVFIGQRLKIF